jgi:hypothetical protein
MKRILTLALCILGAVALFGCPVYSDNRDQRICTADGTCWDCPSGSLDSNCVPWQCNVDNDCPLGDFCSQHACVPGNTPPGGNCPDVPCPSGFICKLSNGTPMCVAQGDAGSNDGGTNDAVADAPPDTHPPFTGCQSDADCASLGAGEKCLDGVCTAPANQCSDGTQCQSGESCVGGVCTPSCTTNANCPSGYSCDTTKGVCTGNPTPCNEPDAGACPSGTTCVDQHCVPPCGDAGACPAGEVCVDYGCIPDQKPQFVCNMEGVQDMCAVGSICLHHNCYIGCNMEAGATACQTADRFNVCKAVTTSTGTYDVCGSSSNLGNQCDPTQGQNCAPPSICIDGYCK